MSRDAAMPTGVAVAGLGARAIVSVLDVVPMAALSVLVWLLAATRVSSTAVLVVTVLASILGLAWLVFLWWGYATRGQGPAAKWLRIRVLRLSDGRPVGWGRYFLRELVWYATMLVPLVWLLLVIMMVVQPRRRGWHDLAGRSVVVAAKGPAAPSEDTRPIQRLAVASANMVALPPHLMAPQLPYVPAEPARSDAGAAPTGAPITAVPDFGPVATTPSASFAPTPAAAPEAAWDPWAAQQRTPQPQPSPYPQQVPYNAPAAYAGEQVANPYAPQGVPSYPPVPPSYPQLPPYAQQQAVYASPAQAVPPAQPMIVAEDDDATRTHLAPVGAPPAVPRKATDGWQLRFDDGRTVPVHGLVLIGRSPSPKPDEHAELVQAGVESRMVSKTHLAVGLDHRGLYVMDRGSTNGTAIANSGGQFEPCAPGDPVRVREGQIVSFGDRYLEVRREQQ